MNELHEILLPEEYREAEVLLHSRGLELPENTTFGLGMYEEGRLIGTGFLAGDVICGIGVARSREGGGVSAAIVTGLVRHAMEQGLQTLRLFTKPEEAPKFAGLGFVLLAATAEAALLEWGTPGYSGWIRAARARITVHAENIDSGGTGCLVPLGAVVMNANPFTLGHRYLATRALERCARLVVFVVEEDASSFPFPVRLRLVTEGLRAMERVLVLPGGPYMVSRASFPSYFTGKEKHAGVYAELDCALFAGRIAPDLGIGLRAVGSEPCCAVTALYNRVMHAVLPEKGVECLEVPRCVTEDGTIVSASLVRAGVAVSPGQAGGGHLEDLVPETTREFLSGSAAEPIIARLREKQFRH